MEDSLKRANELCMNEKIDEAEKIYKEILPEADEKQSAKIHMMLGIIYSQRGKPDEALNHYKISLEGFRKSGNKIGEGSTLGNMVCVYRQKNDNEKALECVEESARIHEELGSQYDLAQVYCLKATILADLNRVSESDEFMNRSVDAIEKTNNEAGKAEVYFTRGRLYKLRGRIDEAKKDFGKAREISKGINAEWIDQFVKQIENEEKSIEELGG
jgi:tetratricopeptide (TPR) repeat protein